MDHLFIQNIRYKLQKRVSRLNSAETPDSFFVILTQFWKYLTNQQLYMGIIEELISKFPKIEATVDAIYNKGEGHYGETEEEAAVIGYKVLERIVNQGNAIKAAKLAYIYHKNGSINQGIDFFREFFLEPFYEYLDEQLDDQKAVLSLLKRYKHRSEWFYRDYLYKLSQEIEENNKNHREEFLLTINLYSFLYDQGIDFTIEPSSITGKVDLISAQDTKDPIILDAKIFDNKSRGKLYIKKAFNQIYTYTQQYNEPFGYLVIFKVTDHDLNISTKINHYNLPIVTYNHKTIFFIVIDIFTYEKSISQRGELKSITITEDELIKIDD